MRLEKFLRKLAIRRQRQAETEETINKYCWSEYGLPNFFSVFERYCPKRPEVSLVLARQISTPNTEHLLGEVLADFLNCNQNQFNFCFQPFSFKQDSMHSANTYKKALVKIPEFFRSRNGRLTVQYSNILPRGAIVDGLVLADIKTRFGNNLPSYHQELAQNLSQPDIDLSAFFRDCWQLVRDNSGREPERVFSRNFVGDKERLVSPNSNYFNRELARPPADWYYFFYLCLFATGRLVLLEEFENPKMENIFQAGRSQIKELTGFSPLILRLPIEIQVEDYRTELFEMPKWVLSDSNWKDKVLSSVPAEDNLSSAINILAEKILTLSP